MVARRGTALLIIFSSCVLSCCCPCVQFGLNQRSAFGESCFKWVLLWLLPLVLLYIVVDQWLAPSASTAELAVQHVEHEVLASATGSATATTSCC